MLCTNYNHFSWVWTCSLVPNDNYRDFFVIGDLEFNYHRNEIEGTQWRGKRKQKKKWGVEGFGGQRSVKTEE